MLHRRTARFAYVHTLLVLCACGQESAPPEPIPESECLEQQTRACTEFGYETGTAGCLSEGRWDISECGVTYEHNERVVTPIFYTSEINGHLSRAFELATNAIVRIQSWYKCATEGYTFRLHSPPIVIRDPNLFNSPDAAWQHILNHLDGLGMPIWEEGQAFAIFGHTDINFALGASNFDLNSGVGMVSTTFAELGVCEVLGPRDWPCDPEPAMAHELGHAFGLAHPDEIGYAEFNDNSIMGTHWWYPRRNDMPWGLLTYERATLRQHPLLFPNVNVSEEEYCQLPVPDLPPP